MIKQELLRTFSRAGQDKEEKWEGPDCDDWKMIYVS
jgi:hypothetical protein